MSRSIWQAVRINRDPLELLRLCGGYYKCPKGPDGKRVGSLVGYAGKYDAGDGTKKQYVGDVYYNFARAEQYPHVRDVFARALAEKFIDGNAPDVLLGAPLGGILLADAIARMLGCRVIFAEKKVTAVATESSREESKLTLDRHEVRPSDTIVLVEDVCNNFSTTDQLISLVENAGAEVMAIVCAINRSKHTMYQTLHVESVVHVPTAQFKQEDPEVADDVAAGNVVWKPKEAWDKLAPYMQGI